ncbi:hypothetical protein [Moorena sp. SIO4G3]|nr:hypothetical protein [Moorena sp. SIO4G3]NEO76024.1 hypothetical protein [Moorena sp. SIO4G3]
MFRTQTQNHSRFASTGGHRHGNLILNGKSAPNQESRQATEGGEVGED